MVLNPGRKLSYSIFQSRLYNFHVPRKILVGVNILKKSFKMSVSRPKVTDPANSFMHAQTLVTVKGSRIGQEVAALKKHCPTCESRTVVSRGKEALIFGYLEKIMNRFVYRLLLSTHWFTFVNSLIYHCLFIDLPLTNQWFTFFNYCFAFTTHEFILVNS